MYGGREGMAYSGAELAQYLGVTTSAVNRLALSEELPGLELAFKSPFVWRKGGKEWEG